MGPHVHVHRRKGFISEACSRGRHSWSTTLCNPRVHLWQGTLLWPFLALLLLTCQNLSPCDAVQANANPPLRQHSQKDDSREWQEGPVQLEETEEEDLDLPGQGTQRRETEQRTSAGPKAVAHALTHRSVLKAVSPPVPVIAGICGGSICCLLRMHMEGAEAGNFQ